MLYRSIEITNGRHADRVRVTLGLNHNLPTSNRVIVVRNGINASIPARLSNPDLSSNATKLFLEHLSNQILKILPVHRRKIGLYIQGVHDPIGFNETRVLLVQSRYRSNWRKISECRTSDSLQALETGFRVNSIQFKRHKFIAPSVPVGHNVPIYPGALYPQRGKPGDAHLVSPGFPMRAARRRSASIPVRGKG